MSRTRRRRRWRNILCGGSSREVLARLMHEDPLDLTSCVESRLRRHALLLDAERVTLRAAAQCARQALGYRGDPGIDRWIEQCVDDALLGLQAEDLEAERRGQPPSNDQLVAFEALARPLGFEPYQMHRVCLVHNRLPRVERVAFREVVLDGRPLDDLARSSAQAAAGGEGAIELTGVLRSDRGAETAPEASVELVSATDWARAARRALTAVLACMQEPQPPRSASLPGAGARGARRRGSSRRGGQL